MNLVRRAAAVAACLIVAGCSNVVHGHGSQGAVLQTFGVQHTLCTVISAAEVGSILDLAQPQPSLAAFRMRPPAEDGCILSFSTADVSLSISIGTVQDSDVTHRLDRDPKPAVPVAGIATGQVTQRSGVAVVGGHLVDVTVDPTHGAARPAQAKITQLLKRAVAAYPAVHLLPSVATQSWCLPGAAAAATLLGGSPIVARAAVVGGSETCGWGTATVGVIVERSVHANASTYVRTTLRGKRYDDTVIADRGTDGQIALIDRSHVMTIFYMASDPAALGPGQVYPLYAALRSVMR